MSDAQDADDNAGTRFPFITLEKAMARAQQLYSAAGVLPMTPQDVFETWKYSPKSSGGFQTIAALKSYGLLKQVAARGENTKLVLTPNAIHYFREERPEKRLDLLRTFALEPTLIKALWAIWGFTPPADHIARSHLKVDRALSEQGARTLLGIFKENIDFAELKSDAIGHGASVKLASEGEAIVPEGGGIVQPLVSPPPPPPPMDSKVKVIESERVVFIEEGEPNQYLKLIASGEVDGVLLEALADFVKRQRRRLKISEPD